MGGIGKAIGSIANLADDVLGLDPNGGGATGLYNLIGQSTLGIPIGDIGSTATKAIGSIAGDGQQGGGFFGQLGGAVGAGLSQAQKNESQDKLADTLLKHIDKSINTQQGFYDKSLASQNKVLTDTPKAISDAQSQGIDYLKNSTGNAFNALTNAEKQSLSDIARSQGLSIEQLQQSFGKSTSGLTSAEQKSLSELAKAQGLSLEQLQQGFGKAIAGIESSGGQSLADLDKAQGLSDARLREGFNQGIQNLQPYKTSGDKGLTSLTDLTLNPQSQANLIKNNPFYDSLVNDAQSRLTKNQATKGKLGSGDTAKALQDEVLKIGSDLMQQEIANRNNLANYGINASQGQANLNQNLGTALSNLYGETARSGSDIRQNTANNVANLSQGLSSALAGTYADSARYGNDIRQNTANNIANLNQGFGSALANIYGNNAQLNSNIRENTANNVATLNQNLGKSLLNLVNDNAQFNSKAQQAGANNITNLNTGFGNTLSNLFKNQSEITGLKLANQENPYLAGVGQFLRPNQSTQQQGSGIGDIFGSIFGGGSGDKGGGFNLGNIFNSGSKQGNSIFSGIY